MGNKLKILQINQQDSPGGAAQVALNLHRSYLEKEIGAYLAVGKKRGDGKNVLEIQHEQFKPKYIQYIRYVGKKLEQLDIRGLGYLGGIFISATEFQRTCNLRQGLENFYAPGTLFIPDMLPVKPDIIHLHNLHQNWNGVRKEYFDLNALPILSRQFNVVITMHDAWLLSGHCAHSFDCDRWEIGCGLCPDLSIYPAIRRDSTKRNWEKKKEIFKKSRLHIITPCKWLMERACNSILSSSIVSSRVIPNGVDLSIFNPVCDDDRLILDIPQDAYVLLFTADGIRENKFKDFEMLRKVVKEVAESFSKTIFLALGETGETEKLGKADLRYISYKDSPKLIARYYRAADIYIHAAKVDTFPNTVIEALACGTPVVATGVGGIPEQIIDGETGFLVSKGDVSSMVEKIKILLNNPELIRSFGNKAYKDASERFDLAKQVEHHLDYFENLSKEIG